MTQPAATLRDRIAAAIYERNNPAHSWADAHPDDRLAYGFDADAVLAVLPEPADRAAVLNEAADAVFAMDFDEYVENDENIDSIREAWDLGTIHGMELLRRLAAEAQPATRADTKTLAAMFEGLGLLLATSSRDWGQYAPDAWLYAVILGWDCEETEHDETCTHGAMEEMQQRHGWSGEAVAKARRYRAAVRALTEPAAGARQDGAEKNA